MTPARPETQGWVSFSGEKVILSPHATSPVFTKRTWRQRLSSSDLDAGPWYARPWAPWRRFTVHHKPVVYRTALGFVIHPALWRELQAATSTEGQ